MAYLKFALYLTLFDQIVYEMIKINLHNHVGRGLFDSTFNLFISTFK